MEGVLFLNQSLDIHSTWKTALSSADYQELNALFLHYQNNRLRSTATMTSDLNITFLPLFRAINHKNELLVTAFVTNNASQIICFKNVEILYHESNMEPIKATGTIHNFDLQPFKTTVWSFIFPNHCIKEAKRIYLIDQAI